MSCGGNCFDPVAVQTSEVLKTSEVLGKDERFQVTNCQNDDSSQVWQLEIKLMKQPECLPLTLYKSLREKRSKPQPTTRERQRRKRIPPRKFSSGSIKVEDEIVVVQPVAILAPTDAIVATIANPFSLSGKATCIFCV